MELYKCPFCSGEAYYDGWEEGYSAYLKISCRVCGSSSQYVRYRSYYNGLDHNKDYIFPEEIKEQAALLWNRRVSL